MLNLAGMVTANEAIDNAGTGYRVGSNDVVPAGGLFKQVPEQRQQGVDFTNGSTVKPGCRFIKTITKAKAQALFEVAAVSITPGFPADMPKHQRGQHHG